MSSHAVRPAVIGAAVRRIEDPRILTGRTRYIDDVVVPGMLEAAVLRSPHPHARIRSIDITQAKALPGVFDVIVGADVDAVCLTGQPVIWHLVPGQRMPRTLALATDKVRYVGEPVAAVAAIDRYVAEDALALIEVDYEILPAAATLDAALAPDAPLLYEEWGDNISGSTTIAKGDAATAFSEADVVVSTTIDYGRQMGTPLETRGAVATWDRHTGELDIWMSSQAPNLARDLLGEVLGVPVEKIRVRLPDIGGGFGNKFDFYAEEVLACILSRRTGRPVKLIEDRLESFVANAHSREQRIVVEMAATAEGRITGLRGKLFGVLGGSLSTVGAGPPWCSTALMTGPYDIPHVDLTLVAVMTNRSPYGSYRGWGQPKGCFAHERLVEALARKLGKPANDIRRLNLIKPDQFPYFSPVFVYDSGDYVTCLELAEKTVEELGWNERRRQARSRGRNVGIGYGFHVEISAFGPSRILNAAGLQHSGFDEEVVRIDSAGGVTVLSGQSAMGQGVQTALAQVAAHTLGVPLDTVKVIVGDTESCPFTGYGTGASRGGAMGGAAVLSAATKLRAKVLRIAAHMLEADPDDLTLTEGVISVTGAPDSRSVTMKQIGDAAYRRLLGAFPEGEDPTLEERFVFDPDNVAFSYGCTTALVEVDPATGRTTVLEYLLTHDCGVVINPMIVDGQIHGGAAQGIGGTLLEELIYDESGQIVTTTFMDYLLPTATDIPNITTRHLETPAVSITGGFKGVGECGTIGAAAALSAAVEDAVEGVRITRIPITPDRLRAMITANGARV